MIVHKKIKKSILHSKQLNEVNLLLLINSLFFYRLDYILCLDNL